MNTFLRNIGIWLVIGLVMLVLFNLVGPKESDERKISMPWGTNHSCNKSATGCPICCEKIPTFRNLILFSLTTLYFLKFIMSLQYLRALLSFLSSEKTWHVVASTNWQSRLFTRDTSKTCNQLNWWTLIRSCITLP